MSCSENDYSSETEYDRDYFSSQGINNLNDLFEKWGPEKCERTLKLQIPYTFLYKQTNDGSLHIDQETMDCIDEHFPNLEALRFYPLDEDEIQS